MNAVLHRFQNSIHSSREGRGRSLLRGLRWKMVAALFVCYLIRDLTLYVLMPLMLVRSVAP